MTEPSVPLITELDNGPYDVEFFFDPGCPFAWLTSVWIRRVAELREVRIGWRFISLKFLNETKELPEAMVNGQNRSLGFLRVCAAARVRFGNEVVGDLYRAWGEAFWYDTPDGGFLDRIGTMADRVNAKGVLQTLGLPEDLALAESDPAWDAAIRSETEEAIRRTGPDVGTPIITYDPPLGNSLFGPVISSVPDDALSVAIYDALRTLVDFTGFSELKRSNRAPIDLPLLRRV
jgi:2-hydroxychromene-2-carboxylate isomerase